MLRLTAGGMAAPSGGHEVQRRATQSPTSPADPQCLDLLVSSWRSLFPVPYFPFPCPFVAPSRSLRAAPGRSVASPPFPIRFSQFSTSSRHPARPSLCPRCLCGESPLFATRSSQFPPFPAHLRQPPTIRAPPSPRGRIRRTLSSMTRTALRHGTPAPAVPNAPDNNRRPAAPAEESHLAPLQT